MDKKTDATTGTSGTGATGTSSASTMDHDTMSHTLKVKSVKMLAASCHSLSLALVRADQGRFGPR